MMKNKVQMQTALIPAVKTVSFSPDLEGSYAEAFAKEHGFKYEKTE